MIIINSSPRDALKIFQPFLPIFVPIGPASLVSVLEKEGIGASLVDEQVEDDLIAAIERELGKYERPYIFGFSVLTAALGSALRAARDLKARHPDSWIIFGGIHPTAMPEEVLGNPEVDLVLRGEAEGQLPELHRSLLKADGSHKEIPGLSYRKADGSVVHNERLSEPFDMADLPPFPYHLFDPGKYDLGFVISSRGCPYNCVFCSNRITTGRRYRFRPVEAVLAEIELLHGQYGIRSILFVDDNLLVNRQRVYALMEGLRERGLVGKVHFNFQARGDNVTPELLRDLYAHGFRSVFFGLETTSDEIMKTINKGETVAQCTEAVRMAKAEGFHVSATFIFALPGEGTEDRLRAAELSNEIRLDMVRFNNATPYPGTKLYDIAKEEGRLHVEGAYDNFVSVSTFVENPFRKIPFSYVPPGNTELEIRRDILFSYFRFYLDVNRLKGIFLKPELGVGWFNAGGSLLAFLRKVPALFVLALMLGAKFGQFCYYCTIKPGIKARPALLLKIFEGFSPSVLRQRLGRHGRQ